MTFDTAKISSSGGREVNEDFADVVQTPALTCWAVADGLGGHRGGEVASKLAVEEVVEAFRSPTDISPSTVSYCIERAHERVRHEQEQSPQLASMRTTIVLLICDGEKALWGHVGDARLYHFRRGGIRYQTKDHSVPQTLVAAGEIESRDIRFHEDRGRILRALGQEGNLKTQVPDEAITVQPGDAFLLCTDGFWEYVTEARMEVTLAQSPTADSWLGRMEQIIWSCADDGHDNYSAIGVIANGGKER